MIDFWMMSKTLRKTFTRFFVISPLLYITIVNTWKEMSLLIFLYSELIQIITYCCYYYYYFFFIIIYYCIRHCIRSLKQDIKRHDKTPLMSVYILRFLQALFLELHELFKINRSLSLIIFFPKICIALQKIFSCHLKTLSSITLYGVTTTQ